MRYNFIPMKKLFFFQKTTPNFDKGVKKLEPSYITGENLQWFSHFENIWHVILKVNKKLSN